MPPVLAALGEARMRRAAALRLTLLAIAMGAAGPAATAQEAQIRKALAARLPQSITIDEVTETPIPGMYQVRSGAQVFYSDRNGDYVIRGDLLDTRRQVNLTQAYLAKASAAIDFSKLPLQDAIVTTHGRGTRKLVVFADPECPYCKQLEAVLQQRDDLRIYTFLLPILGPASLDKAKAIWCSTSRDTAWHQWMLEGKAPAARADCDTSALDRNLALGSRHAIGVTPTLVFEDGTRTAGAPTALQLEERLAQQPKK